jgi:hypothetical protein
MSNTTQLKPSHETNEEGKMYLSKIQSITGIKKFILMQHFGGDQLGIDSSVSHSSSRLRCCSLDCLCSCGRKKFFCICKQIFSSSSPLHAIDGGLM